VRPESIGLGLSVELPLGGWKSDDSARDSGGDDREDVDVRDTASDESTCLPRVFGDDGLLEEDEDKDLAFRHSFFPESRTR
jgi:hypothetical protein